MTIPPRIFKKQNPGGGKVGYKRLEICDWEGIDKYYIVKKERLEQHVSNISDNA